MSVSRGLPSIRSLALAAAPIIYFVVDRLAVLGARRRSLTRALVIRTDAIGDFLLWLPFARALLQRMHEDGLTVTLVANSVWGDLVRHDLPVDEMIVLDRRRFIVDIAYRMRMLRSVRKAGYAIAYHPTFSREFLVGDSLVRATGAPMRVGHAGDLANIGKVAKRVSDGFYTRLVMAGPGNTHEIIRNREFLQGLGIAPPDDLRASECGHAVNPTGELGEYFVVAPGASWATKRWPLARFAVVVDWIARKYGWKAIIVGTAAERPLAATLAEACEVTVRDLCGSTSLSELSAIIATARLVISNDSSHVHFAFSSGTPAVCIVGGGHFGRFLPYPDVRDGKPVPVAVYSRMDCFGCQWRCKYPINPEAPVRCIDMVTIEDVRTAVEVAVRGSGTGPSE